VHGRRVPPSENPCLKVSRKRLLARKHIHATAGCQRIHAHAGTPAHPRDYSRAYIARAARRAGARAACVCAPPPRASKAIGPKPSVFHDTVMMRTLPSALLALRPSIRGLHT